MADLVTDPGDPRLMHGVDAGPAPQAAAYLVLSADERSKGFVRPLRRSYRHVGPAGPRFPLVDLTPEQRARGAGYGYVKYEPYPPDPNSSAVGRYWTQAQLDAVDKGCGTETRMGLELCETYARNPGFYSATYCVGCRMHRPVGEFVWVEDGQRVGS
jgi:hypothetical protein